MPKSNLSGPHDDDPKLERSGLEPSSEDFSNVDLSGLDLRHIDIENDDEPFRPRRWLTLVLLLLTGSVVLWLPHTEFYRLHASGGIVFFVVCVAAVVLGVAVGRWMVAWGHASAERYALRRSQQRTIGTPDETHGKPSTATRWVTPVAALAGAATILFAVPSGAYFVGDGGYSAAWFAAASGAVVVGILVGRWLVMQSGRTDKKEPAQTRITLPPWIKWVTFAVLLAMGAAALVGPALIPSEDPETLGFVLGGVGFTVGVFGAIWLARRFDEAEQKIREEARQRRRR